MATTKRVPANLSFLTKLQNLFCFFTCLFDTSKNVCLKISPSPIEKSYHVSVFSFTRKQIHLSVTNFYSSEFGPRFKGFP